MNISHRTSFYTIIPKEDRCVNAPTQETEQVQSGEEAGEKKKTRTHVQKEESLSQHVGMLDESFNQEHARKELWL